LLLEGMRLCTQFKGNINLNMNSSLWSGDLYDEFTVWHETPTNIVPLFSETTKVKYEH